MSNIQVKRIYEEPESADGMRILVDRLWPRGIAKEKAQLTLWMKVVAPSTELRKWFGHIPERFAEFEAKYRQELSEAAVQPYLEQLRKLAVQGRITLLYAKKEEAYNHALILKRYLEAM
ncbi:DUF488 domain-containing protein [Brevibacillus panacihumi]|uniref:DUF488 domain-containing protein n=1 Tax=Brevibacillus panacihumi TaxID=497735 RepID=UPI003D006B45